MPSISLAGFEALHIAWLALGVSPMHTRLKLFLIAPTCLVAVVLAAQQPTSNPGNTAAGEALFFGKGGCGDCHEVNGRGGVTGPDLSAAGARSPEELRAKILNPSNSGPALAGRGGPLVVIVRTQDGRQIEGVRRNEDTFTLQMMDVSGQLHLLDKTKLAEVRYENRSLMPGDYTSRLSTEELR